MSANWREKYWIESVREWQGFVLLSCGLTVGFLVAAIVLAVMRDALALMFVLGVIGFSFTIHSAVQGLRAAQSTLDDIRDQTRRERPSEEGTR